MNKNKRPSEKYSNASDSNKSSRFLIISPAQAKLLDQFDPSILDTKLMGVPLRGGMAPEYIADISNA